MARAGEVTEAAKLPYGAGSTANELNAFRRRARVPVISHAWVLTDRLQFFEKSIKHEALKQSTTEQAIAGTDRPSEKER